MKDGRYTSAHLPWPAHTSENSVSSHFLDNQLWTTWRLARIQMNGNSAVDEASLMFHPVLRPWNKHFGIPSSGLICAGSWRITKCSRKITKMCSKEPCFSRRAAELQRKAHIPSGTRGKLWHWHGDSFR